MSKKFVYSTSPIILGFVLFFLTTGCNRFGSDKIAFVDSKEIVSESEGGKLAAAKLQSFAQIKKAEVEEQRKTLLALQEEFQKDKDKLGEADLKKRQIELLQKNREFEAFVATVNHAIAEKNDALTQKILPEIYKIVRRKGIDNGYTAVLDINTAKIIYHKRTNELTNDVLDDFNKDFELGLLEIETLK